MFFGGEMTTNEVCTTFFRSHPRLANAGIAFNGTHSPPLGAIRSQIETAIKNGAVPPGEPVTLTTFFINAPEVAGFSRPDQTQHAQCAVVGGFLLDVSDGPDGVARLRGTVLDCSTQEQILAGLAKAGIQFPHGWRSMDVTHLFVAAPAAKSAAKSAKSVKPAKPASSATRPVTAAKPASTRPVSATRPASATFGGAGWPFGIDLFVKAPAKKAPKKETKPAKKALKKDSKAKPAASSTAKKTTKKK